jgi:hypothetical protein
MIVPSINGERNNIAALPDVPKSLTSFKDSIRGSRQDCHFSGLGRDQPSLNGGNASFHMNINKTVLKVRHYSKEEENQGLLSGRCDVPMYPMEGLDVKR